MFLFIRYNMGANVYTRLRDSAGKFWDFNSLTWETVLNANCKIALTEKDNDGVESLYTAEAILPVGGPWIEEVVNADTNRVVGYGDTTIPIESTSLTLRQILYGYVGSAANIFSKVAGSLLGTIDFYVCSYSDFAAGMNDPANATFICKLNALGVMLNSSDVPYVANTLPVVDGEVLFFKFSSGFSALVSAPVFNVYNSINKGNTRIYVPLGAQYVASIGAYYPTTSSGLLIYENGNLISLGETAYGKALGMIPQINWDRISQPVNLTTTQVIV